MLKNKYKFARKINPPFHFSLTYQTALRKREQRNGTMMKERSHDAQIWLCPCIYLSQFRKYS